MPTYAISADQEFFYASMVSVSREQAESTDAAIALAHRQASAPELPIADGWELLGSMEISNRFGGSAHADGRGWSVEVICKGWISTQIQVDATDEADARSKALDSLVTYEFPEKIGEWGLNWVAEADLGEADNLDCGAPSQPSAP